MVRSTVVLLEEADRGGLEFMSKFELIVEKAMEQESRDRAS